MIAAVAGTAVAQPVQWRVEDGGNGHWYEVLQIPYQTDCWSTNLTLATSRGGYLCSITTGAENQFVSARVLPFAGNNASLGGYLDLASGSWKWVTGEPFGYTNWQIGEPGCCAPNEYWLDMNAGNGKWRDRQECVVSPPGTSGVAIVEYSADCNADGIVDKGQILAGELSDTNNNGIPDGPGIAVQPTDQSVSVGNAATFIVQVAAAPACTTPVTYQWQRRNPAVADPAAPGAWIDLADDATFSGAQARNLSITNPIPALATGYRCKIGGGCGCEPNPGGFVYTDTVNFNIACPADFNADGGVDFTDVEAFFERWENGC
jgi:hypothetical protein